jgi:hypothetical protein
VYFGNSLPQSVPSRLGFAFIPLDGWAKGFDDKFAFAFFGHLLKFSVTMSVLLVVVFGVGAAPSELEELSERERICEEISTTGFTSKRQCATGNKRKICSNVLHVCVTFRCWNQR